jgi:hypothetical protein
MWFITSPCVGPSVCVRGFEACGNDQQDLEVRQHHLAVGGTLLTLLLLQGVDQIPHLGLRVLVQRDTGNAVVIVDAAAPDLPPGPF